MNKINMENVLLTKTTSELMDFVRTVINVVQDGRSPEMQLHQINKYITDVYLNIDREDEMYKERAYIVMKNRICHIVILGEEYSSIEDVYEAIKETEKTKNIFELRNINVSITDIAYISSGNDKGKIIYNQEHFNKLENEKPVTISQMKDEDLFNEESELRMLIVENDYQNERHTDLSEQHDDVMLEIEKRYYKMKNRTLHTV